MAVELPMRSPSPVLTAVVWTLLSGGVLLSFCFLFFTLRFKNNRIVKMSSPNLNVLTLFGSVLTYGSGFLFAFDERTHLHVGAPRAVLQARMWTLCVGSTLVFGPILGKTWRLYRVFTQRVPDKRVIIRDIQLMGMAALLVLVDLLVLTTWSLTDPIRCSRSVGAAVKVVKKDVSYTLSQLDSCSSVYSHLWIIVIAIQKGCLLLYGTYLAGLTSNVSHPPVNQSPTIITAVTLVTLSCIVAVPVSIFLQTWPNLVYSTVAGAIFICTLATNCMLFVPQLTQWRQFEEEHNNPSQMAKYFSSPSKSQPSVYSQEEIFYLLGENNSMKKLLSEKIAVIDSLQEQVNNAKDKLLRLMSVSQTQKAQEINASNLNSSSMHGTALQLEGTSPPPPRKDIDSILCCPDLPTETGSSTESQDPPPGAASPAPTSVSYSLPAGLSPGMTQRTTSVSGTPGCNKQEALQPPTGENSPPAPSMCITSCHSSGGIDGPVGSSGYHSGSVTSQQDLNVRLNGIISSEQLREILQELSVNAAKETSLSSPHQSQTYRIPPEVNICEAPPLSPCSLRTPRSTRPPVLLHYPTISPYAMRKRRPPFRSSRRGLPLPYFSPVLENAGCGKKVENCETQSLNNHTGDDAHLQPNHSDPEVGEGEEEVEGRHRARAFRYCRRCVSRPVCKDHARVGLPHEETGLEERQPCRHIRYSSGSWDSDTSSSSDYCYYHRPYCDSCLQRGSLLSSDSSSDSSDSEYGGYAGLHRAQHPVVFKDDLKPTFV